MNIQDNITPCWADRAASWVLVDKMNGKAVAGIYNPIMASKVKQRSYDILPLPVYLQRLSAIIEQETLR